MAKSGTMRTTLWTRLKSFVLGTQKPLHDPFFSVRSERLYLGCIFLFVLSIPIVSVDKTASDFLHWGLVPWDHALQVITWFGDGRFLIPLCLFLWVIFRVRSSPYRNVSWIALHSAALAGISVQVFKMLFGRPRPYLAWDTRFHGLDFASFYWMKLKADFNSFPSGHTTITFAIAWVFLSLKLPRSVRVIVALVTLLIAFSRVALGKHFIADILSAAALGIGCAQWVIDWWRKTTLPMLSPAEELTEFNPGVRGPLS